MLYRGDSSADRPCGPLSRTRMCTKGGLIHRKSPQAPATAWPAAALPVEWAVWYIGPREAYISTKEADAQKSAWISRADANAWRPANAESAPGKRETPAHRFGIRAGWMPSRTALGRLARDGEYRVTYREGIRHATTHLVVYARPNTLDTVRLGVVVGKRFGRATARNRLRRRLREATRSLAAQIQPGVDLILAPRAGIADVPYSVLLGAVRAGLNGTKVLVR